MSELIQNNPEGAQRLKKVIDRLAAGASVAEVKKEFHDIIKNASAEEVATMEQSLIDGGLPVEEVQRLCDVHANLFKEGLEKGQTPKSISGHPVHTFMAENREAKTRASGLSRKASWSSREAVKAAIEDLKPIIIHYTRKENQLFPYLERYGFTGPSKVMWGKHDEIRALFKEADAALDDSASKAYKAKARKLASQIKTMIFMEERILFPNALKRLTEKDWADLRKGEDAIGFAWVKPGAEYDPILVKPAGGLYSNFDAAVASAGPADQGAPSGDIPLSEGALPREVLDLILTSLPMDFSFVDADDKVRYYSDSPHRVFARSPAIIGRDVRNCHPHKSVDTVEKILDSFKKKEKDKAEFWLELNGRFIFINYKPIYSKSGDYLGTVEMSMDVTEIRALEGRRTLLDW